MTTNIINTTAATPSSTQNVAFNNKAILLLVSALVAVVATLLSFKIGMLLIVGILASGAYIALSEIQDMSFDFELENNLMTEIVAELEQRN